MPTQLLSSSLLPQFLEELDQSSFLALDTEFHTERSYLPRLFLVQVHLPSSDTTWVIDPLESGLLGGCREGLLSKPWLVHAGAQDIRLLRRALGDVPQDVWDTQVAAGLVSYIYPMGLERMRAEWLGCEPMHQATMTDWSKRPLTERQIAYAAEDAAALPALWESLLSQADRLGRREAIMAACREARADALEQAVDMDAWRTHPASLSLTPRQCALLQRLLEWREREGAARNQPSRSMLSDGHLKNLCRLAPTTLEALTSHRRLPKGLIKNHGQTIVQIVCDVLETPDSALPTTIRRHGPRHRALEAVDSVFRVWCAQHHLAPRLVLPQRDLHRMMSRETPHLDGLLPPWRAELVEKALMGILQGQLVLTIEQSGLAPSVDHP